MRARWIVGLLLALAATGCGSDDDGSPAVGSASGAGGSASGAGGASGADAGAAGAGSSGIPAGYVSVTDFGAVGDGTTDDSTAFQSAADEKQPLWVPAPAAYYRITTGIRVYASVIGDGSMPEIRLDDPSGDWDDSILQVVDYAGDGLTISGLHLNGGWNEVGIGEHSSGVHIGGSANVTVEKMSIENLLGDGVYVGGGAFTQNQSQKIVIRDNQIETPRRCDVAVIHVDGLTITNNSFQKSNTYVSDLDIEPNPNGIDNVWNVVIDGNTFDSPIENAVSLYHASDWPVPSGGLGGNIEITNNSGDTAAGVNVTGPWVNVTQTANDWW